MISHGPTKVESKQTLEKEPCDVFRSINKKNANKEMNRNLHGNTFTSSTSKYCNDDPRMCFETKYSERVPPILEAETPPHLPSQPVPPSPAESNYDTVNSSEPTLTADQHYPPNVTNLSSSASSDNDQLSMSKARLGQSSQLFDSAHYLSPSSTETCQVIKDAEIAPGLYRKRLELHNPGHSDEVANLDATGGAVDSMEQKATVQPVREKRHFPSNENKTGYIAFTLDPQRFSGSFQYPLPSEVAEADRISKNARSCVFTMYHSRQEYAVKKRVYRSKEISIHSQLCHPNIINLEAVLIGEKLEEDKYYAYHFMLKMDVSFRDVLSTREDGCLKRMKTELTKKVERWALVLVNIQYILRLVLGALGYIHSQKLVHCEIKASNILIKRRCQCQDLLFCTCHQEQKAVIKLANFSSLDVTSDETVSSTAGDIWSFGCFLLETFLNKCERLDIVVEEHIIELLKEVQICYADNPRLCDLMHQCLQVNVLSRPTVKELLTVDFFTKPVYEPSIHMLSPYTYL